MGARAGARRRGAASHQRVRFPEIDFRNNVRGDVYVFLLGTSLEAWWGGRAEFLRLTGPTPLLPDYAWGTWFSRWHPYTEAEAKAEVLQWNAGSFPLDV